MVGDQALDPAATYTLATNDFTAVGGDEYTMFAKYPTTGMYGALDEALINYMQKLGAVDIQTDGRISEGKKPLQSQKHRVKCLLQLLFQHQHQPSLSQRNQSNQHRGNQLQPLPNCIL